MLPGWPPQWLPTTIAGRACSLFRGIGCDAAAPGLGDSQGTPWRIPIQLSTVVRLLPAASSSPSSAHFILHPSIPQIIIIYLP
ncbi:hypothetical protein VTJ04DRAFT_1102 [Mycothermus thermophilus]|uniref:uncharacterized protein n=1 Tax=Humicola insolens TaxID=85995 RepID=UPI0037425786